MKLHHRNILGFYFMEVHALTGGQDSVPAVMSLIPFKAVCHSYATAVQYSSVFEQG